VGRVRKGNEDAYLVDPARGVFLVADGMGGHLAGEVASAIAAETVGRALAQAADAGPNPDALRQAISASFRDAHLTIAARSASDPLTEGMGTTCTACGVLPDGTYLIGHVGDSRAYLMRGGSLAQVTRDHTWVQREVDAGRLTPRQARTHRLAHIITRALGVDEVEEPDVYTGTLVAGDLLLLATDGLTGMVRDRILQRILRSVTSPQEAAATLIEAANDAGGADNVTAVLVRAM
jgi:protein phosphatase